ncbi:MAG: hypothetical protein K6G26_11110 [Lachnospiraceae bacterium]|nr:hypothetical protein [Lachnospiraceae bacterium]
MKKKYLPIVIIAIFIGVSAVQLILWYSFVKKVSDVKHFWDYPNVWISEENDFYIDKDGMSIIDIDDIEQTKTILACRSFGGYIDFTVIEDYKFRALNHDKIISGTYKIKNDIMYMKIDSDCTIEELKGKTIELRQSDLTELPYSDERKANDEKYLSSCSSNFNEQRVTWSSNDGNVVFDMKNNKATIKSSTIDENRSVLIEAAEEWNEEKDIDLYYDIDENHEKKEYICSLKVSPAEIEAEFEIHKEEAKKIGFNNKITLYQEDIEE